MQHPTHPLFIVAPLCFIPLSTVMFALSFASLLLSTFHYLSLPRSPHCLLLTFIVSFAIFLPCVRHMLFVMAQHLQKQFPHAVDKRDVEAISNSADLLSLVSIYLRLML